MRRRVRVIAVSVFVVLACIAPLVFLRVNGGMRVLSPGWLAVGVAVMGVFCTLAWILSPAGHPEKPRRGDRLRRMLAAPPLRIAVGLFYGVVFILFMVAFTSALTGRSGSLLIAALGHLPMGLMMAGMSILGGVYLRRQGPPRCAGCHYDLSGPPEGGYDRCPECGADLRAPASIVRERREMHRGVLATGLVFAAAPFVWFFFAFRAPLVSQGWYLPYVPTGSLIAEVTGAPRGFTMSEWAELGTRALTPAQERRLFDGMLGLRADRGHVDSGAEVFMDRIAESGGISAALRERYYNEMLISGLKERSQSGAKTVEVSTKYSGPLWGTFVVVGMIVTEFEVEGVPVHDADRLSRLGAPLVGASAEAGPGPSVALRPEDWGGHDAMTVRARGWYFAIPPGSPLPSGEGAVFPSGTLWTCPLDLSITLKK